MLKLLSEVLFGNGPVPYFTIYDIYYETGTACFFYLLLAINGCEHSEFVVKCLLCCAWYLVCY